MITLRMRFFLLPFDLTCFIFFEDLLIILTYLISRIIFTSIENKSFNCKKVLSYTEILFFMSLSKEEISLKQDFFKIFKVRIRVISSFRPRFAGSLVTISGIIPLTIYKNDPMVFHLNNFWPWNYQLSKTFRKPSGTVNSWMHRKTFTVRPCSRFKNEIQTVLL